MYLVILDIFGVFNYLACGDGSVTISTRANKQSTTCFFLPNFSHIDSGAKLVTAEDSRWGLLAKLLLNPKNLVQLGQTL